MDTKNYVFGRGKLYFDRFVQGTTTKTGEMYFGNSTEFNINVTSQQLDHYDSDEGVNTKDDSVQTELNRGGTLITDNMSDENIALFILGDVSDITQDGTAVVGEAINGGSNLLGDRWYQLGATTANPTGVRGVSAVTLTADPSGTPVTATEGTDYEIDLSLGRFMVIAGGALDGIDAEADYTPDANTRKQVATSAEPIDGALRFVATNPKGKHKDVYIPNVQLSANGDWALKGDDWQNVGFNISVNQLPGVPAMFVDGRPA